MLEKISIDDLPEEQKVIAEIIGLKPYLSLVKYLGGSSIYIFKISTLTDNIRNKQIKKEFDGKNYREIARKYDLSTKSIRNILKT